MLDYIIANLILISFIGICYCGYKLYLLYIRIENIIGTLEKINTLLDTPKKNINQQNDENKSTNIVSGIFSSDNISEIIKYGLQIGGDLLPILIATLKNNKKSHINIVANNSSNENKFKTSFNEENINEENINEEDINEEDISEYLNTKLDENNSTKISNKIYLNN